MRVHRKARRYFLRLIDKDTAGWRIRPQKIIGRSNPVAVKAWHHAGTGRYRMISYLYMLAWAGRQEGEGG
jgi:hypothetical protein